MILKVYSVFDRAVGDYGRPFFEISRGSALRAFSDIAKDETSAIGKHPQDFTLFELGDYDTSNGTFSLLATPYSCGVAVEFLAPVVALSEVK